MLSQRVLNHVWSWPVLRTSWNETSEKISFFIGHQVLKLRIGMTSVQQLTERSSVPRIRTNEDELRAHPRANKSRIGRHSVLTSKLGFGERFPRFFFWQHPSLPMGEDFHWHAWMDSQLVLIDAESYNDHALGSFYSINSSEENQAELNHKTLKKLPFLIAQENAFFVHVHIMSFLWPCETNVQRFGFNWAWPEKKRFEPWSGLFL